MSKVVKIESGKKKLDVLERLMLLQVLPKEGNYSNLKALRVVREKLSFTEAENKALAFREEAGMLRWNPLGCPEKEIFFGEIIEGLIVKALKALNKQEKLTVDQFSLYEKFVGADETE
jgi:hypothetical protein